ncbi:MAG: PLP-dependent aminotransferase family protein [Propionibacteriaceae bacterium]
MAGADFLQLDPAAAPRRGRVEWLTARLRTAILDGTLAAGVRLPATRVLADDLSMARGTVVEAYRRLTEEGLVVPNRGGGTVVADRPDPPAAVPPRDRVVAPELFDISSGMPDLSAFPRAAWLRAERRVLTTATSRELGYADPQGVRALREALTAWLARSRGVAVDPDRIIVTAGVTGALSLLAQVLRQRGIGACAVEDPGAEGNRRILDHWMDSLTPVPVDADGLDVATLSRTRSRAVLVTPAHQFPTGVVLSPERRRALVAWAEAVDGLVIEDDYDAEYRYDRSPVHAVQAMAPERVAHVSSLSKVLAPALRIGWMIAPTQWHADLARQRWATDLGSPALPQLALADLIDSGVLEKHLRSLRGRHRQRRDAAVEAIRRHLPGCTVEGVAAGLHLVVRLPDHLDDAELSARAAVEGIAVHALSRHRFVPGPPGLVIGYGPHPAPRLTRAIEALGALVGG